MKKFLLQFAFVVIVLTICDTVYSQTVSKPKAGPVGSWRLLGSVTAGHSADHDVIAVTGAHDYFRRIKFKVTNSPVNVQRLVVTYDGGGLPEKIETRFQIPQGGESRIIDLNGGKRKIRTIEFWYDTKGILHGKANVSVLGIK